MKTAISIDDSFMEQADNASRELGLSSSGLIAEASRRYLQHRRQAQVLAEETLVATLKTKLPVLD